MQKEEFKQMQRIELEKIIEEYKHAYIKFQHLDGFGEFKVINAYSAIKEKVDPKLHSDSTYDSEFGNFYFFSLAETEYEMFCKGKFHEEIPFSALTEIIDDMVSDDLTAIQNLPTGDISKFPSFIHAWYDEKLRAAIRGCIKAKCKVTGVSLQHLDKKIEKTLKKRLPKKIEEIRNIIRATKNLKKYIIISGVAVVLANIVSLGASYFFADDRLKHEKQEVYSTIDKKISSIDNKMEAGAWKIIGKALDLYAPNIKKDKTPQERLPYVIRKLEAEKKKELMNTAKKELVPYIQNNVYGRQMSEKEIEMLANNIKNMFKSGKISLADLLNPPEKKE